MALPAIAFGGGRASPAIAYGDGGSLDPLRCSTLGVRCSMLSQSTVKITDTGYWMLDTGCVGNGNCDQGQIFNHEDSKTLLERHCVPFFD